MYRVLKYAYRLGLTLNGASRSSRKWDPPCCPERFCFTARSQFSAFISLLMSEHNCSRILSVTPIKILLLDGIKLWFSSVRYSSYLNIITVNFVEASLFSSVISPLVVHNSKPSLSILIIQKNQFWICQHIFTASGKGLLTDYITFWASIDHFEMICKFWEAIYSENLSKWRPSYSVINCSIIFFLISRTHWKMLHNIIIWILLRLVRKYNILTFFQRKYF